VLLIITGCQQAASGFSITLGGDIMLSRSGASIFENDGAEIDPWQVLRQQGVLDVEDDYFMANLESPLGDIGTIADDMNLCGIPSEASILTLAQLDLAMLVNNHNNDCAERGAIHTAAVLEENGILSVGETFLPVFLDTPQGRMAVLAAQDVTGDLDEDGLLQAVAYARDKAGLVIVSIHWGNEYQAGPDERQQALARRLADAGADVVWGHHPHVLQKMEYLEASDGRNVLVLYSLGNLLSDQWMLEDAQRSALVRLTFDNLHVSGIEVIPIHMNRYSRTLQVADDAQTIVSRLQVSDFTEISVNIFSVSGSE